MIIDFFISVYVRICYKSEILHCCSLSVTVVIFVCYFALICGIRGNSINKLF